MTTFSVAQFQSTIGEINTGMTKFSTNLNKLVPTAQATANRWYIPPHIAKAIVWVAEKSVEVGTAILNWFKDLIKGALAPIFMFQDAWEWMDIRGKANLVAGNLTEQNLVVDDSDWSGKARDAYLKAVSAQSNAATRVGSIAGSTSNHLLACAAAGAAFYVTLAVVLVKLIAATVTAIAAFGSAVFSWAGVLIILEEAGVNTAIIGTALATLTAFVTATVTTMVNLHGEAVDPAGFPGGKWPKANSSQYNDATVKDGDADWSLKGD